MPRAAASSKMIMLRNPNSPISEVYRTLKLNIEFSGFDRDLKTIAVTSVGHGEGKTTTTLNLAAACAMSGKKVMIIDADLRKPALHLALQETNGAGLTNYLAGQKTLPEIVKQTQVDNLSLIASGPVPPNPSELLASERMSALLAELKPEYDMILLDTPPALALADARIIAAKCDGTVLVVDQSKLKRAEAVKLQADLAHVKANLLGIVFNKMNGKDAAAYIYRS